MTNEFSQLNLHPQLVQAVTELGYETPTPIQSGVIPVMLAGQDVIGQAQTGTGKTAAFSLPILHRLTTDQSHVQALVVAPTRELAMQVARAMHEYGRFREARVLPIYGGQPYGRQIGRLKRGVDIVVGTPGRLLDLIQQKYLDLSRVQTVVLDEADEMLSMGFIEDIETILKETSVNRQTALFSATMPAEIRRLADQYLHNPQSITIQQKQLTVAAVEQRYYLVNQVDKMAALTRFFEVEPITRALVFARTRLGTGDLASEMSARGFQAEVLNGDLSQDAREQVLSRFRRGQIQVLVATDVAARGLDIDDISHVFNFDIPLDPEVYVHRIGRTARAGKTGVAISLLTPKEVWRLRKIEQYARQKITQGTLPTIADIQAYREAQLLQKMAVWLNRGRCSRERELVEAMVAEGHDPVEVAAVALKLARAEEKQRPISRISDVEAVPQRERNQRNSRHSSSRNGRSPSSGRAQEKGMVRLLLNAGKEHGIRPNDVVGTIAYHADIPGSTIGAIRIQPQQTTVDVPERFVAQVLDNSGKYNVHRQSIEVKVA